MDVMVSAAEENKNVSPVLKEISIQGVVGPDNSLHHIIFPSEAIARQMIQQSHGIDVTYRNEAGQLEQCADLTLSVTQAPTVILPVQVQALPTFAQPITQTVTAAVPVVMQPQASVQVVVNTQARSSCWESNKGCFQKVVWIIILIVALIATLVGVIGVGASGTVSTDMVFVLVGIIMLVISGIFAVMVNYLLRVHATFVSIVILEGLIGVGVIVFNFAVYFLLASQDLIGANNRERFHTEWYESGVWVIGLVFIILTAFEIYFCNSSVQYIHTTLKTKMRNVAEATGTSMDAVTDFHFTLSNRQTMMFPSLSVIMSVHLVIWISQALWDKQNIVLRCVTIALMELSMLVSSFLCKDLPRLWIGATVFALISPMHLLFSSRGSDYFMLTTLPILLTLSCFIVYNHFRHDAFQEKNNQGIDVINALFTFAVLLYMLITTWANVDVRFFDYENSEIEDAANLFFWGILLWHTIASLIAKQVGPFVETSRIHFALVALYISQMFVPLPYAVVSLIGTVMIIVYYSKIVTTEWYDPTAYDRYLWLVLSSAGFLFGGAWQFFVNSKHHELLPRDAEFASTQEEAAVLWVMIFINWISACYAVIQSMYVAHVLERRAQAIVPSEPKPVQGQEPNTDVEATTAATEREVEEESKHTIRIAELSFQGGWLCLYGLPMWIFGLWILKDDACSSGTCLPNILVIIALCLNWLVLNALFRKYAGTLLSSVFQFTLERKDVPAVLVNEICYFAISLLICFMVVLLTKSIDPGEGLTVLFTVVMTLFQVQFLLLAKSHKVPLIPTLIFLIFSINCTLASIFSMLDHSSSDGFAVATMPIVLFIVMLLVLFDSRHHEHPSSLPKLHAAGVRSALYIGYTLILLAFIVSFTWTTSEGWSYIVGGTAIFLVVLADLLRQPHFNAKLIFGEFVSQIIVTFYVSLVWIPFIVSRWGSFNHHILTIVCCLTVLVPFELAYYLRDKLFHRCTLSMFATPFVLFIRGVTLSILAVTTPEAFVPIMYIFVLVTVAPQLLHEQAYTADGNIVLRIACIPLVLAWPLLYLVEDDFIEFFIGFQVILTFSAIFATFRSFGSCMPGATVQGCLTSLNGGVFNQNAKPVMKLTVALFLYEVMFCVCGLYALADGGEAFPIIAAWILNGCIVMHGYRTRKKIFRIIGAFFALLCGLMFDLMDGEPGIFAVITGSMIAIYVLTELLLFSKRDAEAVDEAPVPPAPLPVPNFTQEQDALVTSPEAESKIELSHIEIETDAKLEDEHIGGIQIHV